MNRNEEGFYDKGKRLASALRECCKAGTVDDPDVLIEAAKYIDNAAEWVRALASEEYPAPAEKTGKAVKVKHKHGMYKNVLLTDDEYEKLRAQFRDIEARINKLSEYIEIHGKKYKSHYAVILKWARDDSERQRQERGGTESSFDTDEFFELAVRRSYDKMRPLISKD
jgi:hypothetical protein